MGFGRWYQPFFLRLAADEKMHKTKQIKMTCFTPTPFSPMPCNVGANRKNPEGVFTH
jgi:hypothetical protein